MRTQLYAAPLNKARRSELAIPLPVGYDRDEEGQVFFRPNQDVQRAIRLVFERFDWLGSAQTVLLFFRRHELELPRRITIRSGLWPDRVVKPSYQAIYRILTHPAYAGAYTYGKRQSPAARSREITGASPTALEET